MIRRAMTAILAVAGLAALPAAAGAAAGPGLWASAASPQGRGAAVLHPRRARASTLDRAGMETALRAHSLTISLPAPGGGFERFSVRSAPVMAPSLVRRYPQIRTLAGRGIGHPEDTVSVDIGPVGFHASVRGPRGAWYIDPADARVPKVYLSYFGRDSTPSAGAPFVERPVPGSASPRSAAAIVPATTPLRTYRLALLSDPTYAAFFGAVGDDAAVLAAKNALVARVDQVYEEELGVRLELIAGTDTRLNFDTAAQMTGTNGPCGAAACFSTAAASTCDVPTLDATQTALGQVVGASAYDIGHLALGNTGGGIAELGVVGGYLKGWGCTGVTTPTGDLYAIDYVAHEMGHQFGANHPFDGTLDNCGGGNRNAATSVEPGSGSSIMGYAGICGQDDLQPHSDPYFSQRSYEEITNYTLSAQPAIDEVQNIGLKGFGGADSFQLSYGGGPPSAVINAANYTRAGLQAAIQAITGSPVTVDRFGHSGELDALPPGDPTSQGFQVTFDGAPLAGTDAAQLTVVNPVGLTAVAGETEQGGAVANQGTPLPATDDARPVVTAPAARSIPTRTPFSLTGSATDADTAQPALTYMWEQNDIGGATGTPLGSNLKLRGPLFRQFGTAALVTASDSVTYNSPGENAVGTSPTRTFPDLDQILADDTNAATGTCPTAPTLSQAEVDCFSEFLPTAAWVGTGNRTLHFRLTARDGVHGVSHADTALTVVPTAGPFRVTSPAAATSLVPGTPYTVTWSVAGTDLAPISAANVRISLSTDGGQTFPFVLADSTPNDGSQPVTMPDGPSSQVRIRVEGIGSPFFDVSHGNAALEAGPQVADDAPGGRTVPYSDALRPVTITAADADGDGAALQATATGLPAGLALSAGAASPAGQRPGTRSWTLSGTTTAAPGTYPVSIRVTDGLGSPRTHVVPIVVAPEAATATYTGDDAAEGRSGTATLAASVAEIADGSPGDIGTATVTFSQRGTVLCGPLPVTRRADGTGTASCGATLGGGTHPVDITIGGDYTGAATHTLAAANPALCSSSVAITGLSRSGKRVLISGFAERRFAGQPVVLTAAGHRVARTRVKPDGSFSARAKAPRGRHAGATLYQARVGGRVSPPMHLARELTLTRITRTATGTRIRGRLSGARHALRKLSVMRALDCASQKRVKTVRTDRSGRFSVTLARPRAGTTAVYRVRTASGRPRSFSLPVVITRK